jgi:hypothetical protein
MSEAPETTGGFSVDRIWNTVLPRVWIRGRRTDYFWAILYSNVRNLSTNTRGVACVPVWSGASLYTNEHSAEHPLGAEIST